MFGAPEPLMENSRIRAVLAFARVVRDTSNTKDALTAANALLAGTLMDKEPEEVENAVRQIVERAEMIRSAGDQKSLSSRTSMRFLLRTKLSHTSGKGLIRRTTRRS